MRYVKAADVLPQGLIDQIQRYIDGEYLYVPRREANRPGAPIPTARRRPPPAIGRSTAGTARANPWPGWPRPIFSRPRAFKRSSPNRNKPENSPDRKSGPGCFVLIQASSLAATSAR